MEKLASWLATLLMGVVVGTCMCGYLYYKSALHYETAGSVYFVHGFVLDKSNPLNSKVFKPEIPWINKK